MRKEIAGIPPQNIDAEQSVLGSMMIDPIAIDKVLPLIESADFYRPVHQEVFSAVCFMHNCNEPVDVITLQEELRNRDKLDSCGGVEYLMALVDTVPTSANVEYYAKIVQEKSLLRKLQAKSCEIQSRIGTGDAEPHDLLNWITGEIEGLSIKRGFCMEQLGSSMLAHTALIQANQSKRGLAGYTSGFSRMDCMTGGYGQPMFVLLKAYRGEGKTHHLIQSAINCLKAGKAAVIYCMDTPEFLIKNRIIAHLTGINSFRVNRPRDDDWKAINEACNWLWNQPLYIKYDAGITVREISNDCKAIIQLGHEIGLVGIDYAELLGYDKRFSNHEQELSEIANGLKNLREALKVTILLLSQVNEQGQERWSKALGNLCDINLTWKKEDAKQSEGIGIFWSEKNRFNSDFAISCVYDFANGRIREQSLDYSDTDYPPSWPWWYSQSPEIQQYESGTIGDGYELSADSW